MRADGATVFEGEAWQVIVAVTGAFGGGSEVGAADPQDGLLDVASCPPARASGSCAARGGSARHDRRAARRRRTTAARVIEVDLPPGTSSTPTARSARAASSA